jgi:uncharacterized protein with HEPN domain
MSRDYRIFLDDIVEAARKALDYTKGYSREQFFAEKRTFEAVVLNLLFIGEATKNIPQEIRAAYPDVPWRDMAGLRDVIVHQYFALQKDVIWKVVQEDLPKLRADVERILADLAS